jgi:DNA-binding HxlR family transcriptional regulator
VGIRKQPRYFCPVDVTLGVISGKWKPLILFQLKRGPRRFGALIAAAWGRKHHRDIGAELEWM